MDDTRQKMIADKQTIHITVEKVSRLNRSNSINYIDLILEWGIENVNLCLKRDINNLFYLVVEKKFCSSDTIYVKSFPKRFSKKAVWVGAVEPSKYAEAKASGPDGRDAKDVVQGGIDLRKTRVAGVVEMGLVLWLM